MWGAIFLALLVAVWIISLNTNARKDRRGKEEP